MFVKEVFIWGDNLWKSLFFVGKHQIDYHLLLRIVTIIYIQFTMKHFVTILNENNYMFVYIYFTATKTRKK